MAVRDSGPGFTPATLERIFEAFYTTKASGWAVDLSFDRRSTRRTFLGEHE
ncbi:protein of unknown function [Bradyrhizobium vignae]|uniref:Histidine kinase/HSP90-like ATPase domain-containing protein n=1 Tax=Bradyrhizobium vignae TaxID=1549949 RepID=A0A2U3Q6N8_9BRAD|nr:protein of unknown function [Bradyrhizobium vignae]